MYGENNTNRVPTDLPKNFTSKRTTASVESCYTKRESLTYMIFSVYCSSYRETAVQQLTDINESWTKVAPSDRDLFIQRQTRQKDANKKSGWCGSMNKQ